MILVYVCPNCRSLQIASRRKDVVCPECKGEMELCDLTFLEWSEMSASEREVYGGSWRKESGTKA